MTYKEFAMDFWENFTYGFSIKAPLAAFLSWFALYTGGHQDVILLYLLFSVVDMVFGVTVAVIAGTFSSTRMFGWLRKLCTQLCIVLMFASLSRMFQHTAGYDIVLTNWILFLFALMDFSSALDNLVLLGAPVPPIVSVLIGHIRKRTAEKLSKVLDSPELMGEIERALENRNASPLFRVVRSSRNVPVSGSDDTDAADGEQGIANEAGGDELSVGERNREGKED